MWSLTLEKKEDLINKKNIKIAELGALKLKSAGDIWLDDLDALHKKVSKFIVVPHMFLMNINY